MNITIKKEGNNYSEKAFIDKYHVDLFRGPTTCLFRPRSNKMYRWRWSYRIILL